MRKSLGDLAVMVSKDSGIPEAEAKDQVENVLSAIRRVVEDGDVLTMQNFGRFELSYRHPRPYRHFETGGQRLSPGRRVVRFRPAKRFTEAVQ